MVSVGLFTNLKSGKNMLDLKIYGQNRRLKKFRSIVKDGDRGKVYATGNMQDYMTDLESKVQEAYRDSPEVIAIDGGDGTISTVLTTINKYWQEDIPPIAIIDGGTFNVLAKRFDIKRSLKYLQAIANSDDLNKLAVRGINMMHVYDDSGNDHLSFSAGVGMPVDFLEETYKKKHLKFVRVGLMALRLIGSTLVEGDYYKRFNRKKRLNVVAQGHNGEIAKEDGWLGIIAQSIETLGLPKFLPEPKLFRKAETEGRFYAIGTTVGLGKFLQYLPAIYSGDSPSYTDQITEQVSPVLALDHQLKEMKILSDEPFKYQFNGELSFCRKSCLTRELHITAGKNVNFIVNDF